MPSNKVLSLAVLVAFPFMASVAFSQPGGGFVSLCTPEERVQFTCHLKTKIVSLCAAGNPGALTSLTYRYGATGKIELEFMAQKNNDNRLFATYSPASPGAYVTQVWFDKGNVRYLLTECRGGNCPENAGLAVLRGDKVLMDRKCPLHEKGDHPGFARDLIDLVNIGDPWRGDGNVTQHLRSTTELLQIDEDSVHDVDKIYRVKRHPDW